MFQGATDWLGRGHGMLDRVTLAFHWLSVGVLAGLVLLVIGDVAGRGVFDRPLAGVSELMGQAVVIFAFLQGPQAFRQRRFLRNDGLISSLARTRPRIAQCLSLILHGLALAILLPLLIHSVPMLVKDWASGDFVGAFGSVAVPIWPARLAVIVGGTVLALQIVFCGLRADTANFRAHGIDL